jgi:hypothetical protein
VGWRPEGDIFTKSSTERNGPLRRGFDSTVAGSMPERSVSGEVGLNYTPSGLIWRLNCLAANALERR